MAYPTEHPRLVGIVYTPESPDGPPYRSVDPHNEGGLEAWALDLLDTQAAEDARAHIDSAAAAHGCYVEPTTVRDRSAYAVWRGSEDDPARLTDDELTSLSSGYLDGTDQSLAEAIVSAGGQAIADWAGMERTQALAAVADSAKSLSEASGSEDIDEATRELADSAHQAIQAGVDPARVQSFLPDEADTE